MKRSGFYRGGALHDVQAHHAVETAMRSGALERPDRCEKCGETPPLRRDGGSQIEAHHDDYNRPLDVRWLCKRCHHAWHRDNKAVERTPPAQPVDEIDALLADVSAVDDLADLFG